MIEIKNLTKKYGSQYAVKDITFTINKGEIVGFLGPNGAGKTTTMNILTGYISSNEGSVKVDGYDVLTKPLEVKKRIGYLPENPPLYMDMTVLEYLDFVYDLKKAKQPRKKHIDEVLSLVRISDVKNRLIKNLSKGYKQRVGLAQALIGDPEILILDEPTVGLDPKQIQEIRSLIKSLGKERTIILSSHILPEISAVCERVLIISKGRLVADENPEDLAEKLNAGHSYQVTALGEEKEVEAALLAVEGVLQVKLLPCREEGASAFELVTENHADLRKEIFYAMAKAQLPIIGMQKKQLSLEEIFLTLTEQKNIEKEEESASEETAEETISEAEEKGGEAE